jgi:hypothetical protein
MALGRLQPSVSLQLRRLTQIRIWYKVLSMMLDTWYFLYNRLTKAMASLALLHCPLKRFFCGVNTTFTSHWRYWLCQYTTSVMYSSFARANKGTCTANITGLQRVGKAFEYSDYGHHWWHQLARWHHAVISTSAPACGNSRSCPWPSQQGGLQSSGVYHVGDGRGQSWSSYLPKLWVLVII